MHIVFEIADKKPAYNKGRILISILLDWCLQFHTFFAFLGVRIYAVKVNLFNIFNTSVKLFELK